MTTLNTYSDHPTWSPDGGSILYDSLASQSSTYQLLSSNVSTGAVTTVVATGQGNLDPNWGYASTAPTYYAYRAG